MYKFYGVINARLFMFTLIFGLLCSTPCQLDAQIISTIAGNGTPGYSGDGGAATAAQLYNTGVATDGAGNIYVADEINHNIRKVNAAGIITTIAGNGTAGYGGDGGAATAAELWSPTGVAVDGSGNVYIADFNNNRIRKVNTSGIIVTIAGDGTVGYSGDGGPATAAKLSSPFGVAADVSGNIFIADQYNRRIRKVNASGVITTIAGNGSPGYSGDGSAAYVAQLYNPKGVAVDANGNIYIADSQNSRIRKVNTSGVITTIAGNGVAGYSGDDSAATSAKLNYPICVAVDAKGNVFTTDRFNHRVRKIDTSGIITTIAGNGTAGFMGDGGTATAAEVNLPTGVSVDGNGSVYVADYYNYRVRKIGAWPAGIIADTALTSDIKVYPNPATGIVTITTPATGNLFVSVTGMDGKLIKSKQSFSSKSTIDFTGMPAGQYLLTVNTGTLLYNEKIIVQ